LLKSVYIYGSYRKIKTGVPLFLDHSVYDPLISCFWDLSSNVTSMVTSQIVDTWHKFH